MDVSNTIRIAEPLASGDWCVFCENKLAYMHTADGVAACLECGEQFLEAMKKYEDEMAEIAGLHFGPNRSQRRRAERHARRLHNDGSRRQ
jgi:hypothetical protein